ncbi:MAG: hypothetical protein AABX99_01870 [Nanoarchaeota archaeon]
MIKLSPKKLEMTAKIIDLADTFLVLGIPSEELFIFRDQIQQINPNYHIEISPRYVPNLERNYTLSVAKKREVKQNA